MVEYITKLEDWRWFLLSYFTFLYEHMVTDFIPCRMVTKERIWNWPNFFKVHLASYISYALVFIKLQSLAFNHIYKKQMRISLVLPQKEALGSYLVKSKQFCKQIRLTWVNSFRKPMGKLIFKWMLSTLN